MSISFPCRCGVLTVRSQYCAGMSIWEYVAHFVHGAPSTKDHLGSQSIDRE